MSRLTKNCVCYVIFEKNAMGILPRCTSCFPMYQWGQLSSPLSSGPWFNIQMPSYQYRKSHCGDKMVVRSSYLHKSQIPVFMISSYTYHMVCCLKTFPNKHIIVYLYQRMKSYKPRVYTLKENILSGKLLSFNVELISCLPVTLAGWLKLPKTHYTIQCSLCWNHLGFFYTDMQNTITSLMKMTMTIIVVSLFRIKYALQLVRTSEGYVVHFDAAVAAAADDDGDDDDDDVQYK